MIQSFDDYKYYLERDRLALGIPDDVRTPRPFRDYVWRFERKLRELEYLSNCKTGLLGKIRRYLVKYQFQELSMKLGFSIPINCFEEGLYISHYGTIVVNSRARIGKNCRIRNV